MTVGALAECCKEFNKIQRSATLKATRCVSSTSTESLEILTSTLPFDLHLKLRQAQEVVRIAAKHKFDGPLIEEFEECIEQQYHKKETYIILITYVSFYGNEWIRGN